MFGYHPFLELDSDLRKHGFDRRASAKELGVSKSAFNLKMNNKTIWTLYEAYKICLTSGHKLEELPTLIPFELVEKQYKESLICRGKKSTKK